MGLSQGAKAFDIYPAGPIQMLDIRQFRRTHKMIFWNRNIVNDNICIVINKNIVISNIRKPILSTIIAALLPVLSTIAQLHQIASKKTKR